MKSKVKGQRSKVNTPHYIFRSLIIGTIALLFAACGPGGDSFRLRGHITDMQAGELYLYNLSASHARIDTLTVQNGSFLYRGEIDQLTPYYLVFPNGMEQVIFIGPGDDLTYQAAANDLRRHTVSGNDTNEALNKFRTDTYSLSPTAITSAAREYIIDNPKSPVSIYLFDRYFVQEETVSDKELTKLLSTLKTHNPHDHYLLDLETQIAQTQRRAIGKKIPNITLTRPNGTRTQLWANSSEAYTLIVFWATWMPGGYDFLWQLGRIADQYKDQHTLRIVTQSLDVEQRTWQEAVRRDSLRSILHTSDGLGFESSTIKKLGITSIPLILLTDHNHAVIDHTDSPAQLDKMLQKHIK